MVRLSHSAIQKYIECPRKYKHHYIDRIREDQLGSALLFGVCVDEALNELLRTKQEGETDFLDPKEVFIDHMLKIEYNNEEIEVPFSLKIRYSMSDFDPDLIDEDAEKALIEYLKDNGYENTNPFEVMENMYKFIRAHGFMELDEDDRVFYNYANWLSLGQKGIMMIDAYKKDIMPKIKTVTKIQVPVSLPNDLGDEITGYEDVQLYFVGDPKEYVTDNKTSSRKYKEDSVKDSQQLAIYSEFSNLENAAFIVLNKKVRKTKHKTCKNCGHKTTKGVKTCDKLNGKLRCHGEFSIEVKCSIDTQIIKDIVTEEQKDLTFDKFYDILDNIRKGNFQRVPKNECFSFGRKCIYYERCNGHDSTSLKGLVQLPEKE